LHILLMFSCLNKVKFVLTLVLKLMVVTSCHTH
jgi:hypothetical protein